MLAFCDIVLFQFMIKYRTANRKATTKLVVWTLTNNLKCENCTSYFSILLSNSQNGNVKRIYTNSLLSILKVSEIPGNKFVVMDVSALNLV